MGIGKVFQILVPKDKKFHPLFEQAADNVVKAAILLNQLFLSNEEEKKAQIIQEIKKHEHLGDDLTHQIFEELNKTFITPFDREDIQRFTAKLDDVLDYINGSSQIIKLYKLTKNLPEFLELSELILQATREIKTAVSDLSSTKNLANIKKSCIRINEIENQADDIYYNAISMLFQNQTDAIELLKVKEVLSTLELATDRAEDVSDVIKTIVIKLA